MHRQKLVNSLIPLAITNNVRVRNYCNFHSHGNLDSQIEPNVEQLARFYSAWKHKLLGFPSSMSYQLFNKIL